MTVYDFGFEKPFADGADSSEIAPFPDEDRGLGIAFDQTEGKPEMKGLNGLFNKISKSLLSIRQNGLLGWVDDIEYIQGGFVIESGKLYQAKRNNTSKQPSLSQNDWDLWPNSANITVDENGNIIKTNTANGSFSLKVNDSTVSQKGVSRFANAFDVINKVAALVSISPKNAADIAQSTDFGIDQNRFNLTASRLVGSTYQNTTNKPIEVCIVVNGGVSSTGNTIVVNEIPVFIFSVHTNMTSPFTFTVPPNHTYRINVNSSINSWTELR